MSKFALTKASAVSIVLFLFTLTNYPVSAEVSTNRTELQRTTTAQEATSAGTTKNLLIQKRTDNVQEKIMNARERLASRAATLKARLEVFKDRKKAEIAERVNTNLNLINQNKTTQMQRYLDAMNTILNKLEARVNRGAPDIKDPEAARTAITTARTAIASASAAVSAQAQKDYTIQVTTEAKIKTDVKTQRDKLHTDLQALRKTVIETKKAVTDSIRAAKSGSASAQIKSNKEGTTSGQQ